MQNHTELLFDIYAGVEIEFLISPDTLEEAIHKFKNYLYAIHHCFDVELTEQGITYRQSDRRSKGFPKFEAYTISTLLSIDGLSHSQLQLFERTLTNLIDFWNESIFRHNHIEAYYSVCVYPQGKRP